MSTVTIDIVAPKLSGASLRQALVKSARQLQPLLERNASKTEADRRVAEENLTAIRSADLLKITVPRRFGGLETDIRTMLEVSRGLEEGVVPRLGLPHSATPAPESSEPDRWKRRRMSRATGQTHSCSAARPACQP